MKLYRYALPLLLAALLAVVAACGDDDDATDETTAPTATEAATDDPNRLAAPLFSCDVEYPGTEPNAEDFPLRVVDGLGRTVTIAAPPQAIISLSAGHTETLYAVGAGDQVTSVDNTSNCPTAAKALPQIDAYNVSVEAIVAQEPDLVVLFFDPGDLVTTLEQQLDAPVLMMPAPADLAGIYEQIEVLGQATGHADESAELVSQMQDRIAAVARPDEADPPTVFHELDNTYYSVGPGSFIDDIYSTLGAVNIAESTGSAFPQLTAEAIIQAAPDVIILADESFGESLDTVAARPGWDAIPAVENGRVYGIDPDIASRPGPRLAELAQTLAGYLYEDATP